MCSAAPPAPAVPDYPGAARAQGAENLANSRYATQANRPNEITPLGSRTWQQGTGAATFDQPGYDAAMARYNTPTAATTTNTPDGSEWGYTTNTPGSATTGTSPTREQFTTAAGNPDQWTSTIALSPEQQALYDSSNRVSQNLADVGEAGLSRVGQAQSQPFSTEGMPGRVTNIGNQNFASGIDYNEPIQMGVGADNFSEDRRRVEEALSSRLEPQYARDEDAMRTRLSNQGITQGSTAWGSEADAFNRARNDSRMQTILAGGGEQSRLFGLDLAKGNFANQAQGQGYSQAMGEANLQNQSAQARIAEALANAGLANQGRGAAMDEASYLRQLPLNELNALRTGSQVNMPNFGAYGQQSAVPGPNFLGATQMEGQYDQNVYNQMVGAQNANTSGLYGLAGAAATGLGYMYGGPGGGAGANALYGSVLGNGTRW